MTSVKQTAEAFIELDPVFFVRLHLQQGSIARNLKANPNYPADGRAFLGDSLAGLSTALVLREDISGANLALTEASDLGFCEFEKIEELEALKKIKGYQAFEAHLGQLRQKYLAGLKDWSSNEVSRFEKFRFDFHINSVKGGSISSQNRNGDIMVIDLWATWCPPCRQALPHFDRLHKDYRKSGVRVIGISMDSPDDPGQSLARVREFMTKHEFKFACGMGTNELKAQLPADLKLPTTLYVDRTGNVRYMSNGYQDYAKVAAITETLLQERIPVATGSRVVQLNQ
jgi:thiol-disulfide isomerase/thioredoxin